MARIWVSSDLHLGHANIIHKFVPARPFASLEEMTEEMIARHNAVVQPEDHWYCLGDVAIKKIDLRHIKRFNGHKRLVRGNHDIFKTRDYLDAGFEEIHGVRVFPGMGFVLSHIPIHPSSLQRWARNVHGHTHFNRMKLDDGSPDFRYVNVCVEQTNYAPVLLDSL